MKSVTKKKNLDAISRGAMKAQRASFRIEGINISEKRAEKIRQEVVREMKQTATVSAS